MTIPTAKCIGALLRVATDDGTLDGLAAIVHPDVINRFCDAISEMAETEEKGRAIKYGSHEIVTRLAELDLATFGTTFMVDGDIPAGVRKAMALVREARKFCGIEAWPIDGVMP